MQEIGAIRAMAHDPARVGLHGISLGDPTALRQTLSRLDENEQAEVLARQLEAVFAKLMISAMRKTVPEGGLIEKGSGEKAFTEMLDNEFSQLAVEQWNFGFHDALVRQILNPLI